MVNTDQIRLVLFDVDGVLTDGTLLLVLMQKYASLLTRKMVLPLRCYKNMKLWLVLYLVKKF